MEVFTIQNSYPRLNHTAVTLGKFDGIHKGHRKLTEKILEQKKEGRTAVLIAIEAGDSWILSRSERRSLLERMGIDILIEAPLDERMRAMKAESFVSEILVGDLGVSYVAVGEDNRFGCERKGDWRLLQKMGHKAGFEVEVVPRQMDGKRKISSTYIREELRSGNMEKVNWLMDTPFFAEGPVVHGQGLGHKKLLPTVNILPDPGKLMPPNGVYFTVSGFEDRVFHGITNVGTRPTVGGSFVSIESYLFDCDEDLYGRNCRVEFLHFLRSERKFSSLEALRLQLLEDAGKGKAYFEQF